MMIDVGTKRTNLPFTAGLGFFFCDGGAILSFSVL